MMTDIERRQRGIDLAGRMQTWLRRRLDVVTERAREGRASERQVREARKACAASTRAIRNLKRRSAARVA